MNKKYKRLNNLPPVSVVITNWNGKQFILNCLASIANLNYPKELLDVMVVDNASIDGSVVAVREYYSWVRLLTQKKNIGFASAVNVGLQNAKGKYILVLNNDEILDKNCVLELITVAEKDSNVALAGAKIYYMDSPHEIQCMWGTIDYDTMHVNRVGSGEIDRGQYEKVVESDYVSFSCILRKDVIKKLGYLDDRYFIYFEDTDIMLRLKQAGYKLVFVPKAKIWHRGGQAFSQEVSMITYYLVRNNLLIRKKFNGLSLYDHYKNIRFALSSIIFALIGKRKKSREYRAIVKAIFDFYRNRFGQGSI